MSSNLLLPDTYNSLQMTAVGTQRIAACTRVMWPGGFTGKRVAGAAAHD